jgi:hypothetical protein
MNKTEYLILCLVEELGEVQKEALKCLRFTLDNKAPGSLQSNFEKLKVEWSDVVAIVEMLHEENIKIVTNAELINSKKIRTEYFYEISKDFGVVK